MALFQFLKVIRWFYATDIRNIDQPLCLEQKTVSKAPTFTVGTLDKGIGFRGIACPQVLSVP